MDHSALVFPFILAHHVAQVLGQEELAHHEHKECGKGLDCRGDCGKRAEKGRSILKLKNIILFHVYWSLIRIYYVQLAELQKQIQEERQIQELRELQVASGQVVRNTDTTMDWMYEGPAAQQQQFGEDYLLGKIYKAEDNRGSSVAGVDLRRGESCSYPCVKINAKSNFSLIPFFFNCREGSRCPVAEQG